MKPVPAFALILLAALVPAARAATGEIGLDAAGVMLEDDVEPALRLRGGVHGSDTLLFEAQVLRTLGSEGTLTSVMVGPTLELPVEWCGGDEGDLGAQWTLSGLVGGGRAESAGVSDDGFAWQGGLGVKWKRESGVNLRLEGGWQGIDAGTGADGPFLAFGVGWRIGD